MYAKVYEDYANINSLVFFSMFGGVSIVIGFANFLYAKF